MDGVLHFVAAVSVHVHDVGPESRVISIDIAVPIDRRYRSLFLRVSRDIDRLIGVRVILLALVVAISRCSRTALPFGAAK